MRKIFILLILVFLTGCQEQQSNSRRSPERALLQINSENPNAFQYILNRIAKGERFNETD